MTGRAQRWLALAAATALMFAATVVVLLRIMPAPRTPADYLIIGTTATLISLAAVFGGVALVSRLRFPRRWR
jgi:hypothetical protein